MARFYGSVGYCVMVETAPSVYVEKIVERKYKGNVIKNVTRPYEKDQVNDKIKISNSISIVADPYARENFQNMRYVEYLGVKWDVDSIEVEYPRMTLSIGGEYHGPTPGFGPNS